MSLEEIIAEEFVLWEMAWQNRFEASREKVAYWTAEMQDSGITPEQFRAASSKARKTSDWPPSVAEFLKLAKPENTPLPHYYREWKALPMPEEPPATKEQIKQILDGMTEGGRRIFLAARYGDEEGRLN